MRAAVISVTERGRALSERLAPLFDADRFCYRRHTDEGASAYDDIMDITADIFKRCDVIVFICAAGIAVRASAPHISSKLTDPAVIVIDDCGRFVIPILSGHIGGANQAARLIAEHIGAQAVITTATDTGGHFSPDSMAKANGLIIDDMDTAKRIAAAVLEGKRIGLYSSFPCVNIPDDITQGEAEYGIAVSGDRSVKPFPVTLHLIPKNIIVGVGCRRGTPAESIAACVRTALGDIPEERISAVATIDIKADEAGLIGYCGSIGAELITFTAEELMDAQGEFSASDFVRSVTGTDNVCERSAVCAGGRLIVKKTALDGVTAAAAEKDITIDFARTCI